MMDVEHENVSGVNAARRSKKKKEPIPGGDGIGSEKPGDLGDGGTPAGPN
jgi:hypothetical protein